MCADGFGSLTWVLEGILALPTAEFEFLSRWGERQEVEGKLISGLCCVAGGLLPQLLFIIDLHLPFYPYIWCRLDVRQGRISKPRVVIATRKPQKKPRISGLHIHIERIDYDRVFTSRASCDFWWAALFR